MNPINFFGNVRGPFCWIVMRGGEGEGREEEDEGTPNSEGVNI